MTPGDAPALVVMCRAPVPGRAKTRLAAALGPERAAALALAMTLDVLDALAPAGAVEACVARPADAGVLRALAPPGTAITTQPPGDLGARMAGVMAGRLAAGRAAVVLTGADCPLVTAAHAEAALDALRDGADAAVAPAADGGYGLIAVSRPRPELLAGIPWSTDRVMAATRRAAERAGLRLATIAPLDDVDRPEDLPALHATLVALGDPSPAPRTRSVLHAVRDASAA